MKWVEVEVKVRRGNACGRAEKELLAINNQADCMPGILQRQENLLWHVLAQQKPFAKASRIITTNANRITAGIDAIVNVVAKVMPGLSASMKAVAPLVNGAAQLLTDADMMERKS